MKYDDFVCFVQTEVENRFGEEVRTEINHVMKNNSVELDGLTFCEKECCISPTIYLNGYYDEYRNGKDPEEIVNLICETYQKHRVNKSFDLDPREFLEFERAKKHLACKLVNYERNRELLEHVPHFRFLDLAVVIYLKMEDEFLGEGMILIHYDHLAPWGITEEELFFEARRNMRRILPEHFGSVAAIIGMDQEIPKEIEDSLPMYVLTNETANYGAASIIYDSILQEIGEVLGEDFWIIPSSVHECIILPVSTGMMQAEIEEMIRQVNSDNVSKEEYLSDHVYFYLRDLHKISVGRV